MRKHIIIAMTLGAMAMVVGCGKSEQTTVTPAVDSAAITAAQKEQKLQQARYDSLYRDSVNKSTLTTRDLAFFELQGPVKSVTYGNDAILFGKKGKTYTFSPEGIWQNKPMGPDITGYTDKSNPGYSIDYRFTWNNGHVTAVAAGGYEDETRTTFVYDLEHPHSISASKYNSSAEGYEENGSFKINNPEYDQYGNWVARSVTIHSVGGYDGEDHKDVTNKTERHTRVIEYYDLPSPSQVCPGAKKSVQ